MVDLTRDEWDDMQGFEEDEDWEVECARCGVALMVSEAFVEEGDEWECEGCNIRCDAKEYYDRGEYVHVDIYILESGNLVIADGYHEPIVRHLSKG